MRVRVSDVKHYEFVMQEGVVKHKNLATGEDFQELLPDEDYVIPSLRLSKKSSEMYELYVKPSIKVLWNGKSTWKLKVDCEEFKGQMMGMCGNMDKDPLNDNLDMTGTAHSTSDGFATSWIVGKKSAVAQVAPSFKSHSPLFDCTMFYPFLFSKTDL